jgi:hypothetical protein
MVTNYLNQKRYVFTDFRYINPHDIRWTDENGELLPLYPDTIEKEAIASNMYVPFGLRLAAQKAVKRIPLPEDSLLPSPYYTIVKDGGVFRLWHLSMPGHPWNDQMVNSNNPAEMLSIRCLESVDGYSWSEKSCSRINAPGYGHDGFSTFIDPQALPGERYKAVWFAFAPEDQWDDLWVKYKEINSRYRTDGIGKYSRTSIKNTNPIISAYRMGCLYGAISPDGADWTILPEPLIIHQGDFDTAVYYDHQVRKYVMYQRLMRDNRRVICRIETDDFRRWANSSICPVFSTGLAENLATDVYLCAYTSYPGITDQHLMFPTFYNRQTQDSQVRLLSSSDGQYWQEVPGGPVLEPENNSWDSAWIYCTKNLVPVDNQHIGLIYYGTPYPHKYPRWEPVRKAMRKAGWALWEKGRLCAVSVNEKGGFCTFPVIPAGRKLHLNVRTKRAGMVKVGLRTFDGDVQGRTLRECCPIIGNGLSVPVLWGGEEDIAIREGVEIELVFDLCAAELFGYEWI